MTPKDVSRWNARVSLVYAIGIWTMFGTYAYYHTYGWPRKKDESENASEMSAYEEAVKDHATEYKLVQEDKKSKEALVTSTIVYRENFVPYSTRAVRFLKSVIGSGRNASETQGNEK